MKEKKEKPLAYTCRGPHIVVIYGRGRYTQYDANPRDLLEGHGVGAVFEAKHLNRRHECV